MSGVEGKHNAYAGVGPFIKDDDEQIKHTYYQWVCFVLLGQAVMFYIPRYLWKIWEGGRLKALASDLGIVHFRIMLTFWNPFEFLHLLYIYEYQHKVQFM